MTQSPPLGHSPSPRVPTGPSPRLRSRVLRRLLRRVAAAAGVASLVGAVLGGSIGPAPASAPADSDEDASSRIASAATAASSLSAQARVVQRRARASERFEAKVVDLVAQARGQARTCGGERFGPARSLSRSAALDDAAGAFAQEMGRQGFFDHTSPSGADPADRARSRGFRGSVSETIAAGQRGPGAVVRAWLASPGHCSILMSRGGAKIGVGFAQVPGSPYGTYWVLNVGS